MEPSSNVPTPFGQPVKEIPLVNAPLVSVVAQVKFPPITSIANESFIGSFQEAIRERYPVLRHAQETALLITQDGVLPGSSAQRLWQFSSTDGQWRVSLATSWVALQATRYTSRTDFFERLEQAVKAVQDCFKPAVVDRLGVRYVDRFDGMTPQRIVKLVRPELYGIVDCNLGSKRSELKHSITDTLYGVGDAQFHARWGWLPQGMTVDPTMEPAKTDSWLLDLDMFYEKNKEFDAAAISGEARGFAEQIYRFFRWAMTPAMLEQYGSSTGSAVR